MDSTGEVTEIWDTFQLMGKAVSFRGLSQGENAQASNGNASLISPKRNGKRMSIKKAEKDHGIDKLMLWGQPGHLTQEEANTYVRFFISA
jgi:hypothetical protein